MVENVQEWWGKYRSLLVVTKYLVRHFYHMLLLPHVARKLFININKIIYFIHTYIYIYIYIVN